MARVPKLEPFDLSPAVGAAQGNAPKPAGAIPDRELRWDPGTQHYLIGPIDWNEFHAVLKGNGPCNRERLEARRAAEEAGRWVREAAAAHAGKQGTRTPQAA